MPKTSKKSSLSKRIVSALVILTLMLAVVIYQFWYTHATNGDSPYDEMFIEINGWMPSGARNWACGQIAERFPGSLPPYSCQ